MSMQSCVWLVDIPFMLPFTDLCVQTWLEKTSLKAKTKNYSRRFENIMI